KLFQKFGPRQGRRRQVKSRKFMKRVKAVIVKEFAHILRDPTSLAIIFIMPVLMMLIYGYAMSFDLERVDAGVIDYSQGEISKKLVKKFANNRYFVIRDLTAAHADPITEGEKLLKAGKLKEVIIIPADFSKKLKEGRKTEIGLIIDGSDSNVANLVFQYNELIVLDFTSDFIDIKKLLKINTKIYFNPEVKSSFFFIPGLIAVLLVMISALLTSLSIAREKESGSIDLIFISPLKSPEIIIGKTVPYIVVSLIAGCFILIFARFWFGVPIKGNLLVLLLFSILYIISGLSMGVLISTASPSQKIAMLVTLLGTLLPSLMLSGFIFPLDSMGPVLRGISHIVPATYFLKIIRGVVLKGAELKHFIPEGLALLVFSVVLLILSMIKFNLNRKKSA
ncbi:MAG: ABC transporter permease, partial [Candidatus Aminicenantes bacterium]|nr:ABC transporter permease [Candidatus Aminicenantes bacterium]